MAVLTEQMLREFVQENKSKTIYIDPTTVLTPSAREYINDQTLVVQKSLDQQDEDKGGPQIEEVQDPKTIQTVVESCPYRLYGTQIRLKEKPGTITALVGQDLVNKDRPRIRFRGQMDSLEAVLLLAIGELETIASEQVTQELEGTCQYTRLIFKTKVTGEQVQDLFLLGKDLDEIRDITHHPKECFNRDHLILEGDEKLETLKISCLRTRVREVKVTAIKPFGRIPGRERSDLLKVLNRLNSAFYCLTYLSGQEE